MEHRSNLRKAAGIFTAATLVLFCCAAFAQQIPASTKESKDAPASQSHPAKTKPAAKPTPTNSKSKATAVANPFPLAQSEAAEKKDRLSEQQESNRLHPGDAQSSSGAYSSSNDNLPPPAVGQGSAKPSKGLDTYARDHTLDGRIQDDLQVADFYMKNGNYRGASLRYQDALHYDPLNDTALYGIADVECKQNRTSDAMAGLKTYIKNYPNGKFVKKAEKLLAEPRKCTHNR